MPLTAQLSDLTVPSGTEFSDNVQSLLQLITQYVEIIGLENFSGINFGSTTPAPADRDKPWLKVDGSSVVQGWYTWNGSSWEIIKNYVQRGTTAQRNAITNAYSSTLGGILFFNEDVNILQVAKSGGNWDDCRPAPTTDQVGDAFYFFTSSQQQIAAGGAAINWTSIDISSYISTSGIPAAQMKAAIVRVNTDVSMTFGGAATTHAVVRCWSNNSVSNDAEDVVMARSIISRDDSSCRGSEANTGFVPLSGGQTTIYWNMKLGTSPAPSYADGQVWLVGFIYTPAT